MQVQGPQHPTRAVPGYLRLHSLLPPPQLLSSPGAFHSQPPAQRQVGESKLLAYRLGPKLCHLLAHTAYVISQVYCSLLGTESQAASFLRFILFSVMCIILSFCQLDINLDIPWKRESHLRNCLYQSSLWSCLSGMVLDAD